MLQFGTKTYSLILSWGPDLKMSFFPITCRSDFIVGPDSMRFYDHLDVGSWTNTSTLRNRKTSENTQCFSTFSRTLILF